MKTGFLDEDMQVTTDLATVESQRNDLATEEFPEGPLGSYFRTNPLRKSLPWRKDQRTSHRFNYENHQLHSNIPRNYPGDTVLHTKIKDEHRNT